MFAKLRERILYDPITGMFTWRISGRGFKQGTSAGCRRSDGYLILSIDRKNYLAHRVAFYLMNGEFPEKEIDHADLNRSNNKWENLREASPSQNRMNRKIRACSQSGLKGVKPYRKGGYEYWKAVITKDKKPICLGYFKDKYKAYAAYCAAADKMFGEFSRLS